jgi:hypothetical protein
MVQTKTGLYHRLVQQKEWFFYRAFTAASGLNPSNSLKMTTYRFRSSLILSSPPGSQSGKGLLSRQFLISTCLSKHGGEAALAVPLTETFPSRRKGPRDCTVPVPTAVA